MQKIWLLMIGLSLPVTAETASEQVTSIKEKVESAISKFEQTNRNNWAFQISRYENEEGEVTSSIEQFEPRNTLDEQWTLLSANGQPPSQKQQKRFRDEKLKQEKERNSKKEHSHSIALREIINTDSLQLSSEDEHYISMNFKVYLKRLGKKASSKLQGELKYNKKHQFIEQITIINTDDFSPMFSANISKLALTFSFITINETVLPHKQELTMKGTFAYFTEIDEVSTDSYSNYQFKG